MAAPVRFELTHNGVRVHRLTAWPWGNINYILPQNIINVTIKNLLNIHKL